MLNFTRKLFCTQNEYKYETLQFFKNAACLIAVTDNFEANKTELNVSSEMDIFKLFKITLIFTWCKHMFFSGALLFKHSMNFSLCHRSALATLCCHFNRICLFLFMSSLSVGAQNWLVNLTNVQNITYICRHMMFADATRCSHSKYQLFCFYQSHRETKRENIKFSMLLRKWFMAAT